MTPLSPASLSRALRWPLWSWRNLAVTAATALLLLAGLGRLTNNHQVTAPTSGPVAAAPTTSSAAPTVPLPATTTPPAPSTTSTTGATITNADAASSPVRAATGFVTAWVHTTGGEAAWLAGMRPWATASLLASLTGTDPAQVPASAVVGDAALRATTGTTATVSVPTDGGRVAVAMVAAAGAWKANGIAPDDAPPAAPTPTPDPAAPTTQAK
jgi:hypothetical protein